jgi:hypothetical protein
VSTSTPSWTKPRCDTWAEYRRAGWVDGFTQDEWERFAQENRARIECVQEERRVNRHDATRRIEQWIDLSSG